MRADPRRKMNTLGSKWLRQGGTAAAQSPEMTNVGGGYGNSGKSGEKEPNPKKSGGRSVRGIRDVVMRDKGEDYVIDKEGNNQTKDMHRKHDLAGIVET